MSLYFIAVVPHREVRNKAKVFSKDFSDRYASKKSFDNFPHITVMQPFSWDEKEEIRLLEKFRELQITTPAFVQKLNGFSVFPNAKSPVVFIKPENTDEITSLHTEIIIGMTGEISNKYHPHLTVAYRDLTPENFIKAWTEYEAKEFREEFLVDKICLFKHYNRKWNLIEMHNLKVLP